MHQLSPPTGAASLPDSDDHPFFDRPNPEPRRRPSMSDVVARAAERAGQHGWIEACRIEPTPIVQRRESARAKEAQR